MGTVHYLNTRKNLEYHDQQLADTSWRVLAVGSLFGTYTDSTVELVKARNELDKWYGFFGCVKRFLQPVEHMLAVETLARAEHKQRESYRNFVRAKNKMYEKGHLF